MLVIYIFQFSFDKDIMCLSFCSLKINGSNLMIQLFLYNYAERYWLLSINSLESPVEFTCLRSWKVGTGIYQPHVRWSSVWAVIQRIPLPHSGAFSHLAACSWALQEDISGWGFLPPWGQPEGCASDQSRLGSPTLAYSVAADIPVPPFPPSSRRSRCSIFPALPHPTSHFHLPGTAITISKDLESKALV